MLHCAVSFRHIRYCPLLGGLWIRGRVEGSSLSCWRVVVVVQILDMTGWLNLASLLRLRLKVVRGMILICFSSTWGCLVTPIHPSTSRLVLLPTTLSLRLGLGLGLGCLMKASVYLRIAFWKLVKPVGVISSSLFRVCLHWRGLMGWSTCLRRVSGFEPPKVSHERHIWHVAKRLVVSEGMLNRGDLVRRHANLIDLTALDQLRVLPILELNNLVDILWGWRCLIPVTLRWSRTKERVIRLLSVVETVHVRLQLRLLPLFVPFAIRVWNLKYFLQSLGRFKSFAIVELFLFFCLRFLILSLGLLPGNPAGQVKFEIDEFDVAQVFRFGWWG